MLPANAAAADSSEHKGLHWKPDPVAISAADHRYESRELQARYMKLEADLQESEAARALLQKQLHRVQDAMKQNRNDLEDAQRTALAAEEKAAAAEAQAATLSAEVCRADISRDKYASHCHLWYTEHLADTSWMRLSLQVNQLYTELAKANTQAHLALDQVCRQA